jgi:hypothetical protein
MNWFEDDKGQWWNLDYVRAIYQDENSTEVEIDFDTSDDPQRFFSQAEWTRLRAQLLNSQRPADRRPDPKDSPDA